MANPYIGSAITDCNSPSVGADKDTYTTQFDRTLQVIDEHDHTNGKGNQIPTGGIANGAVTNAKRAAVNAATSNQIGFESSGAGSTDTDSTAESVTNGSVTIVCTGKPVKVYLQGDIAALQEHGLYIYTPTDPLDATTFGYVFLFRDGTLIERWLITGVGNPVYPLQMITFEDFTPTAGSHTYTLKVGVTNAGDTVGIFGARLRAREL